MIEAKDVKYVNNFTNGTSEFPDGITLQNGKSYNLDDIWQAAEWEAIKNCPLIAPDRNAKDAQGNLIIDGPISRPNKPTRNGIAELYIDHPGLDTQRKVSRKQLVHKFSHHDFD